ncbi:heme-dependent peroxidase [Halobacteriales archaeon QS_1_68_17]|nr:MAG: heme-dependent peroxidase [Halobacteriales archaeon QS_1_68_17]
MQRRDPPPTDEGWYVLHDLRTIDWDAWREAPEQVRDRALAEGIDYLRAHESVADAPAGDSAVFSVLGHKADLLIVHLRPTVADLDTAERRFERTELAGFTDQSSSYVSVTEASGYTEKAREYFEGELDEDSGLYQYIQSRLHPEIPDAEHVSFYPMSKRRDPEYNWYELPFDERADLMAAHGDIGREYAGKVTQMISGSVGFDDWEWGVTLWADDATDIKDLIYEMRFHPSSSKYAEFGPFYFGRRFPPADLPALLAGEPVPTGEGGDADAGDAPAATAARAGGAVGGDADGGDGRGHGGVHPGSPGEGDHPHAGERDGSDDSDDSAAAGRPDSGDADVTEDPNVDRRLASLGIHAGSDYDDGDYALVFDAEVDAGDLADDLDGLRGNFEHYDSHVLTTVRASGGEAAVVSVWTNEGAAETAAGFLTELPGVSGGVGGVLGDPDAAEEDDAADAAGGTDGDADDVRAQLADLGIYAGTPHGEDVYALVLYSTADPGALAAEVGDLRESFDHYDTHVKTAVYEGEDGPNAVVSIWETESAAETASDFLADLPGVVGRAGEGDGFGTMGMFYTVKPEFREVFVETFAEVEELLAGMDGHRETNLLVNREDDTDMFIASNWDAREDAMAFFRSDEFAETVQWGREVLDGRPRHVFLA